MFSCRRCGVCCKNLITKAHGCHIGLFLMKHEVNLFPPSTVSPCWAIGMKGRSRPRPDVKSYQLNVERCPHLSQKNLCRIYEKRPMICRAHPLTLHVDPMTRRITSASVDSKCVTCKELGIGEEGTFEYLGQFFSEDILRANVGMTNYLAWMFPQLGMKVWLYDLKNKQWQQITAEIAEIMR